MALTAIQEAELAKDLGRLSQDPLRFVKWAFPWGRPGTKLEGAIGPEPWQEKILTHIRDRLASPNSDDKIIRVAVASGHGVGKSALSSWLALWAITTFKGAKGVVTANTENQLRTKTWAEMNDWFGIFTGAPSFEMNATSLLCRDESMKRVWRLDMIPWNDQKPEAFAGLHNKGRRIIQIFDEASSIPDCIFKAAEGVTSDADTEIIQLLFGNPTKTTGWFRECFDDGKFDEDFLSFKVNAMEVSLTNRVRNERIVAQHGWDSDFVRVRIRGEFPKQDEEAFISYETVLEAINRKPPEGEVNHSPVVIGVDVGVKNDPSVIYARQGNDARSREPLILQGIPLTDLTYRIIAYMNEHEVAAIYIDGAGAGAAVIQRLRENGVNIVHDIQFGGKAVGANEIDPHTKYANRRAEMWGAMKDALRERLRIARTVIPTIGEQEMTIVDELTSVNYSLNAKEESVLLESKKMMASRGKPSPNVADALALTFALPTPQLDPRRMRSPPPSRPYDPMANIYEGVM